jgi:hypothetical protein
MMHGDESARTIFFGRAIRQVHKDLRSEQPGTQLHLPDFRTLCVQGATEALGGERPLGTPILSGKRIDTNQTS